MAREAFGRDYPWAAGHPHVASEYYDTHGPNAIYIAPKPGSGTDHLLLGGKDTGLPAAGAFTRFDPSRHALTEPGQRKRSRWRLPRWFWRNDELLLSRNTRLFERPVGGDQHGRVQFEGYGQEFVFDTNDCSEGQAQVFDWVKGIISAGYERPAAVGAGA
ncbi:MAG: hypothetical protein ACRD0Y_07220 [Terriglobales bacterium]